ncbi:MAG: enoyl-CoA hydratase [Sphingobium sp.]
MTDEVIRYEVADGIALITLWRPAALNALNAALRDAIADAVDRAGADPQVRAVILTGSGDRAFCVGVDLKELGSSGVTINGDKDPVRSIEACPKPVIAAVNGLAITGGFELVLACDVIFAAEEARFADTHVRVGVIPGWGLSQRLSRAIGVYRAKELSLSGNFLSAATAAQWGLVNRVTPRDRLMAEAYELAGQFASAPGDMVAAYKRTIDEGFAMTFGAAMTYEKAESERHAATLTPQEIEARRAGVLARGREQSAA